MSSDNSESSDIELHGYMYMTAEHNRENFGALLKSIIGNLKSIIGAGLLQ